MTFLICPLCCENYIIINSLCQPCTIGVKRYVQLYSLEIVTDILKNVLKRQPIGVEKKTGLESNKFPVNHEKD
jgi:hypothetical protein